MIRGARATLVCAGLALAAHAALLLRPQAPVGPAERQAPAALRTRLIHEAPRHPETATVVADAASPAPQAAPPHHARDAGASPPPATPPEEPRPGFEDGPPSIGFPDAPLPAQGVQLRAYVELATDGSAARVSTASPPGTPTPPVGFQKLTEYGLMQARFKPGLGPAYCLLIRFQAGAPAPTLAWLPGAARDATRCLAGAQPPARELDAPAP